MSDVTRILSAMKNCGSWPPSGFACVIESNPYRAAVWHFGDRVLTGLLGNGRVPASYGAAPAGSARH